MLSETVQQKTVEECKFLILSGPTCSQSRVQQPKAANTQILGTFSNVLGLAPSKDTRTLGHSKVNAVSFLFPIVSLTSELGGWRGRQKGTVCSSSASRAAAEVELLTHSFSSFPAATRFNATVLHKTRLNLHSSMAKRHHHYLELKQGRHLGLYRGIFLTGTPL